MKKLFSFLSLLTIVTSVIAGGGLINGPIIGPASGGSSSSITTSNIVVLGGVATFTPEMFGAVGNGVTDDTVPLQAAINAAQAVGGTVDLRANTTYAISNILVTTNAITIRGQGVQTLSSSMGQLGNATTYAIPTVPPYLSGSVILQFKTNSDILVCSNLGTSFNLENFGLMWHTNLCFLKAGYGVRCSPPILTIGTTVCQDNGIQNSHWDNIVVFGAGSNSYCFSHINGLYNNFTHLAGFGGGSFEFFANGTNGLNGIEYFPGNFTLTESSFVLMQAGLAKGVYIHGNATFNGGNPDHILIQRSQVISWNALPFAGMTAPNTFSYTNPQSLIFQDGRVRNTTMTRCAFENLSGGGPAILNGGNGNDYLGNGFYQGGFPLTNSCGYAFINNANEFTPLYSQNGFTCGMGGNGLRGAIRLVDWPSTLQGGPYYDGFQYVNNGIDSFLSPGSLQNQWTWSTWSSPTATDIGGQVVKFIINAGSGAATNLSDFQVGRNLYVSNNVIVSGSLSTTNGITNSLPTTSPSGTGELYFGSSSQGYMKVTTFDGFQNQKLEMGFANTASIEMVQNCLNAFSSGLGSGGFRFGGHSTLSGDSSGKIQMSGLDVGQMLDLPFAFLSVGKNMTNLAIAFTPTNGAAYTFTNLTLAIALTSTFTNSTVARATLHGQATFVDSLTGQPILVISNITQGLVWTNYFPGLVSGNVPFTLDLPSWSPGDIGAAWDRSTGSGASILLGNFTWMKR